MRTVSWSIKQVGLVCHSFVRVTYFDADVDKFENFYTIAIAFGVAPWLQFGPKANHRKGPYRNYLADFRTFLIFNLPEVAALLRHVRREVELGRAGRACRNLQRRVFLLQNCKARGSIFNLNAFLCL